jgi:hypothetical protein
MVLTVRPMASINTEAAKNRAVRPRLSCRPRATLMEPYWRVAIMAARVRFIIIMPRAVTLRIASNLSRPSFSFCFWGRLIMRPGSSGSIIKNRFIKNMDSHTIAPKRGRTYTDQNGEGLRIFIHNIFDKHVLGNQSISPPFTARKILLLLYFFSDCNASCLYYLCVNICIHSEQAGIQKII